MNYFLQSFWVLALMIMLTQCSAQENAAPPKKNNAMIKNPYYSRTNSDKLSVTEDEWKKILSPELFYIARQKGTERAWSSPLEYQKTVGIYYCAACGNALFESNTKFESGCGWPSFFQPIHKDALIYTPDNSHGMKRIEVQCGRCKAHLGHIFEDGPPPTGLRYCINGTVLDFEKK